MHKKCRLAGFWARNVPGRKLQGCSRRPRGCGSSQCPGPGIPRGSLKLSIWKVWQWRYRCQYQNTDLLWIVSKLAKIRPKWLIARLEGCVGIGREFCGHMQQMCWSCSFSPCLHSRCRFAGKWMLAESGRDWGSDLEICAPWISRDCGELCSCVATQEICGARPFEQICIHSPTSNKPTTRPAYLRKMRMSQDVFWFCLGCVLWPDMSHAGKIEPDFSPLCLFNFS